MSKFNLMNGNKIEHIKKFKAGRVSTKFPDKMSPCVVKVTTGEVFLVYSIEEAREKANGFNTDDKNWNKVISYVRLDHVLDESSEV